MTCDCPIKGDTDADVDRCCAAGPDGFRCTRPEGHGGEHTACNVAEHPAEAWGSDQ
jgi:hypothetical protein